MSVRLFAEAEIIVGLARLRQNASLSTMFWTNSGFHKIPSQREQVRPMRFRVTHFGDVCAGAISGEHGARSMPFVGDPRPGPENLLLGGSDVVCCPIPHGADRTTCDPA